MPAGETTVRRKRWIYISAKIYGIQNCLDVSLLDLEGAVGQANQIPSSSWLESETSRRR